MSDTAKPLEIKHDSANQVFQAEVEGHISELEYRLEGKTMVITHTGVPSPVEGRGIAGLLTKYAVQTAEAKGWKIEPACAYAEAWFKRHEEYGHLLA